MKKSAVIGFLCLWCAAALGAQTVSENDTDIPVDADLSNSVVQTAGTASGPAVKQGLWIEATGKNTSLIRDVSKGTKKGYEFDNAQFVGEANWWFWGDFSPSFHIDAEISVLNFKKTLYQANSYGSNVPDVTWGDGIQNLAGSLFSPISGFNDDTPGSFNKMGFSISGPYVKARLGYGALKENKMSSWTGIYNMVDYWKDVEKGFVEINNGNSIKHFGAVDVYALAATSRMRGTYGTSDVLQATVAEKYSVAATIGSTTSADELFRYNENNDSALPIYMSAQPIDMLKFELHGMTSFGTGEDASKDTSAAAAKITFNSAKYQAHVEESLAGVDAHTVWGRDADTTSRDSKQFFANSAWTSVGQWFTANDLIKVGLDTDFWMTGASSDANAEWDIRNEPMVDVDLNSVLSKDIAVSLYGVVNTNRLTTDDDENKWGFNFEEAGIELTTKEIGLKKIVFDYALYMKYNDWTEDDGYKVSDIYHSIMCDAYVNDDWRVTLGSMVHTGDATDDTTIPFGFAAGFIGQTHVKAIGAPRLWMHGVYGMDPYTEYNYVVERYDDDDNKLVHRSYRLNCLEDVYKKSRISIGAIWDIQ